MGLNTEKNSDICNAADGQLRVNPVPSGYCPFSVQNETMFANQTIQDFVNKKENNKT